MSKPLSELLTANNFLLAQLQEIKQSCQLAQLSIFVVTVDALVQVVATSETYGEAIISLAEEENLVVQVFHQQQQIVRGDGPWPMGAPLRHPAHGVIGVVAAKGETAIEQWTPLLGMLAGRLELAIQNLLLQQALPKTEDDLQRAQQAKNVATLTKNNFLANISHQLRTPLNGILGYTQILQQNKDNTLAPEHLQSLEVIRKNGEHLLLLINDLLDISELEGGQVQLKSDELHLPTFLDEIKTMSQMWSSQQGLQFVYEASVDLPVVVQADEKRLRQILVNLLSNAVKYTEHGAVRLRIVRLAHVEADTNHEAAVDTVRFEVVDTGIGMQPQQLERVFLPFEQIPQSLTEEARIGLGLAICQKLAHMMESEIRITSEVGQGTRCWFDLSLPVLVRDPRLEQDNHPQQAEVTPATASPAFSLETIALPMEQELLNLQELALMGDMLGIEAWATAVEADSDLHPFAERIKSLACSFEEEEILTLIEQCCTIKG